MNYRALNRLFDDVNKIFVGKSCFERENATKEKKRGKSKVNKLCDVFQQRDQEYIRRDFNFLQS
jgi:hypothetical protein